MKGTLLFLKKRKKSSRLTFSLILLPILWVEKLRPAKHEVSRLVREVRNEMQSLVTAQKFKEKLCETEGRASTEVGSCYARVSRYPHLCAQGRGQQPGRLREGTGAGASGVAGDLPP